MFVTKTRIKKLLKNPLGGLMFLNQYFNSLKLKNLKIKNVKYQESKYHSLIDNSEFFDFVIKNSRFVEGNIVIFDKEVELNGID